VRSPVPIDRHGSPVRLKGGEGPPDTAAIIVRSVLGWTIAVFCGGAGAVLAKLLHVSNLPAGQITAASVGLAGGLSHSLLIRGVGGRISRCRSLIFSVVWALSCVGAVTPLFFTFGTAPKMAVLALYSFAVSGALGGTATAFMMRRVFENASSREVIPSVVPWAISFGIAFPASNLLGDGLQTVLPAFLAWPVAVSVLPLGIGVGGGYSLVRFLRAEGDRRPYPDSAWTRGADQRSLPVLLLLVLPFYLNDYSDIYVSNWRWWLFIDYASVRVFPLLAVLWLILSDTMPSSRWGLSIPSGISFGVVFVIATLAAVFIDQNGYGILGGVSGYPPLGHIPSIDSPLWSRIDLTAGLLTVAIGEELVFRGYLRVFLARYTQSSLLVVVVSAVAFGLIHWSGGLYRVMITAAIGAVFMGIYITTRSLPPIVLAHFAVNFIALEDRIPAEIFRFF